jgi:hypothetical protein
VIAASVSINVIFLLLLMVGAFASGYGFGNWVEAEILDQHEQEIAALSTTIDELYVSLDLVYKAYTGDNVTFEQAQDAAALAEWLLTNLDSPAKIAAAANAS